MTHTSGIAYTTARPLQEGDYPGFDPSTRTEGEVVVEQDVAVALRDGTTIYVDVYRPAGDALAPAILAWSPYGKRGGYWRYSRFPNNAGVPAGAVSPWTKFEGPDPVYWCRHGYAVVNVDTRGSWKSEGDLELFGTGEARDVHDVVEWAAAQAWCNAKVAMSGNSYLAMSQWRGGAQRPPHLAALAPWEGVLDVYRDMAMRGGMPENRFMPDFMDHMYGEGRLEDVLTMQQEHPFYDEYWQDKTPDVSRIDVPVYVVASWTNPLHTRGTLEAFKRLGSAEKWLRVHATHEWFDNHDPENMDDLRRFFDRYLKDEDNGWEATPAVRLMLLEGFDTSVGPVAEPAWPIARATHRALHLDAATGTMAQEPVAAEARTSYAVADEDGAATFDFVVEDDVAVVGHMGLRLWVEADGADDMDLFAGVVKVAPDGSEVGYDAKMTVAPGALGWLRVSHRRLDPERSTPEQPYLQHRDEQRLSPGEVVPVDVEIWPWGGVWRAGERIRVKVAPRPIATFTYDGVGRNAGRHVIHTGGRYDSRLLVPFVDDLAREPAHGPVAG